MIVQIAEYITQKIKFEEYNLVKDVYIEDYIKQRIKLEDSQTDG